MFLKRLYTWASNATVEINNKQNGNVTGGSGGWEDLRAPATAVNPAGIVTAPSYDESNVGYNFNGTQDQRIDIIFQLPHGWKRGSNLRPHIHVRPLTNTNGNIVWHLKTSWSNSFGQQPDWTNTNTTMILSNAGTNNILREHILSLGNSVSPSGAKESSCVKYILERLGTATADDYTGAVLLDEFDCHYYHEKSGTDPEYPV
jgi:hypothetical protein